MAGWAALVWWADELRVVTESSECRCRYAIAPDERYGLRLWADQAGRLYLRTADARHPLLVSVDQGRHFEPVPPIPDQPSGLPAHSYKLHPAAGVISVVGDRQVWTCNVATAEWRPRDLPIDIQVRDVSFDNQDGLWCAGSAASRRIPGEETEAAVRYQPAPGARFEPRSPHLSPGDAVRVIGKGGLVELRTIDAEAEPVVATSICSWLLDDSSSFIFVLAPDRTSVERCEGEMICHIDRSHPDGLRVFTHQGGLWQRRGAAWKRESLVAPIVKALMASRRPMLIRGLDARGERIAAAVEVGPPGVTEIAQDPELTAVCLSMDGGQPFGVATQLAFSAGGEIQDVVWYE